MCSIGNPWELDGRGFRATGPGVPVGQELSPQKNWGQDEAGVALLERT